MTPQEAIERLRKIPVRPKPDNALDMLAIIMAVKAIEKQIPKKPTVDPANFCDFQDFHCPNCNKKIISRLDGEWIADKLQSYCDDCSQALDWGEQE